MGEGGAQCGRVSHGNDRGCDAQFSSAVIDKTKSLCRVDELTYTHLGVVGILLPLQIHTQTQLVKEKKKSALQGLTDTNTHQYITHSPPSGNFFCSLGLFFYSFLTLFRLRPHVLWRSFEPV